MSVTNFRREWTKLYAESPIRYHDSIRMYFAKEYLNCGYYTVAEVAKMCGFDDVSYFIRFFKKKTGMTPSVFKNNFGR
jgi:AraC-like DNA-binding protein